MITERLDALRENENIAEKTMHISRYEFAADIINKIPMSRNRKILDIACGPGYGSYILYEKTQSDVVGVDIDEETVTYAIDKYGNNIKFIKGDMTSLNLTANSFDHIVCIETIEHMNLTDGITALNNIVRMLKSGGTLIISSPNRFLSNILYKISGNNPFHLYEYVPNELKKILEQLGLYIQVEAGQYVYVPLIYRLTNKGFFNSSYFKVYETIPITIARYFILVARKL